MVANVVAVLHLALEHDGAGLEAAVRVVREAGSRLAGRQLQLVLWAEKQVVEPVGMVSRASQPCFCFPLQKHGSHITMLDGTDTVVDVRIDSRNQLQNKAVEVLTSMRKGSRLRSAPVPMVRQMRTPAPSICFCPCTTCAPKPKGVCHMARTGRHCAQGDRSGSSFLWNRWRNVTTRDMRSSRDTGFLWLAQQRYYSKDPPTCTNIATVEVLWKPPS